MQEFPSLRSALSWVRALPTYSRDTRREKGKRWWIWRNDGELIAMLTVQSEGSVLVSTTRHAGLDPRLTAQAMRDDLGVEADRVITAQAFLMWRDDRTRDIHNGRPLTVHALPNERNPS